MRWAPRGRDAPFVFWAACCSCIALGFVLPAAALTQTASVGVAPDPTSFPPVVVRAARAPSRIDDPSATVHALDARLFQRARAFGLGLSDVVERSPGVRLLDLGGPLHDRRLSIRGGSPAQSLILIDGAPLSSPFATGLDLGFVGTEGIDRAALVRGGAGAALGDGALSGALAIESRPPSSAPLLSAAVRGGSSDLLGATAAGRAGPVALIAETERTTGRFDYISRLPGLDDRTEQRTNNDAAWQRFAARLEQPSAGGRFDAYAGIALRQAGAPGLETQPNLLAREDRVQALVHATWQRPPRGEALGLQVGAHASVLDIDYRDPSLFDPRASETRFASGGVSLLVRRRLWAGHWLRGAADFSLQGSISTEHGEHLQPRGSIALADELRLDAWTLFAALRGVAIAGQSVALLPRVGARCELSPQWALTLALGRSQRSPTIDELFHPTEAGIAGNPALIAETAWEAELGVEWSPAVGLTFGAGGYARRISDAILYVNHNAFLVRPENVGASLAAGSELVASARGAVGSLAITLDLALTLAWSELRASGAPIPGLPAAAIDTELVAGHPAGATMFEAFTRLRQSSATTANTSGTLAVEPFLRWDAGVRWLPVPEASLALAVTNLLDDRSLETLNKLPLPGRAFLATVRVATGGDR